MLEGTKDLKNAAGASMALTADQFSFSVTPDETNPTGVDETELNKTAKNDAEGKIDFGKLTFTEEGIYAYTVKETSVGGNGITVDATEYTVRYVVTDTNHNGTYTVERTITKGSGEEAEAVEAIGFTNTYAASGEDELEGTKDLKNAAGESMVLTADQFSFSVTPSTANPAGVDETGLHTTATNDAAGKIDFGKLTFTSEGTYVYTVKETSESGSGVTTDKSEYEVSFTAVDNHDGSMTVTKTIDKIVDKDGNEIINEPATDPDDPDGQKEKDPPAGSEDPDNQTETEPQDEPEEITISFVNEYAATGSTTLKTTKAFAAWDNIPAAKFDFRLIAGTNDANVETPMPEGSKKETVDGKEIVVKEASAEKDEPVAEFGSITYMAEGTYNYIIEEEVPEEADENGKLNGIQYDAASHLVTVVVTDENHNGTYTIDVTYGEGEAEADSLTVTNTYAAEGTSELQVTKVFNVWDNMPKDGFAFILTAGTEKDSEETSPMPVDAVKADDGTVTKTANAKSASEPAAFGTITYDKAGEYSYTIKEVIPQGATTSDRGKTYVKDGITYDGETQNVLVKVEDTKHNGEFDVTVTYDEKETSLTVTNTYAAEGEAQFEVSKELTGADLEKDQFEFKVEAQDGAPMPEGEAIIANDAEGKVKFGKILYSLDDMKTETTDEDDVTTVSYKEKTFTYTIKEVIPDGAKKSEDDDTYTKDGITYDGHTVTVTIKATDNGDGTIKTEVSYDGEVTFTNGYESKGSTKLEASKHFAEGNMDTRTYDFEIYEAVKNEDGGFIIAEDAKKIGEGSTATTAAEESSVTFKYLDKEKEPDFTLDELTFTNEDLKVEGEDGKVTYEQEKTYDYIICEVIPPDAVAVIDGKEVTYEQATRAQRSKSGVRFIGAEGSEYENVVFDNTWIVVHVKVTDNGDGTMKVETVDKEGKPAKAKAEFTNAWDKAKLKLTKTITDYIEGETANAAFTFRISGKLPDGTTYEDNRNVTYNVASNAAQVITVDVPYDITNLTVEEVWSGNYEPDAKVKNPVRAGKDEDGIPLYTVSYTNKLTRRTHTKSIVNKYGAASEQSQIFVDTGYTGYTIQERTGADD